MRRVVLALLAVAACGPADPPPGPDGPIIETVAGTGEAAFDGDGKPARQTALYAPIKVAFDRDGRPLIVDWNNHRVRKILADDRVITILGNGFEDGGEPNSLAIGFSVHHPFDFELSAGGELFFAGYHDPRVLKIDTTDRVRLVAGLGTNGQAGDEGPAALALLNAPSGVALAPDGTVYVSDELNHSIRRIDPAGLIHKVAGTSTTGGFSGDGGPAILARLFGPTRIERDPNGDLYFCDSVNHRIRKIDAAGNIETVAGTGEPGFSGDGGPAKDAELYIPKDLVLLDDGSILIADSENHRIRKVDPNGVITSIVGTGEAAFTGDGGRPDRATLDTPWGVSVDAEGQIWIADYLNHSIRRVSKELLGSVRVRR
jgi:DNA-binding beta-propeller fold protein YncE